MRRPSSIEPFSPSPTVTLHPTLQAVLDNLDVQIEEELTRYRRQRRYPTAVTQRKKPISSPASTSDASAIGILRSNIQLPTLGSSIYANEASPAEMPHAEARPAVAEARPQPQQQSRSFEPWPTPSGQTESRQPDSWQTAPTQAPQAPGLNSPAPVWAAPPVSPTLEPAAITSYAQQNDLSPYAPNSTLQKLMHQPSSAAPDDYLASSEELLRSIAEENPELRADREPNSLLDTLLTPLGIGSMLLLLLSSTTLGYVIMHPDSVGLGTRSTSASNNPSTPASPKASDAAAPSPDLASEEFVDLDLDTLSTLPKQSSRSGIAASPKAISKPGTAKPNSSANRPASTAPNSTAARSTTTPSVESLPPAPEPQPSLSTVVVPAEPPVMSVPEPAFEPAAPPEPAPVSPEPIRAEPPVTSAVEPAPQPTVAAAPSPSNPAGQPYYYVVTDYSGDSSLQQARDAVPDAYVRNLPAEGAKVQLGAFSEEAKAQELLQQLQEQGIPAEVYQP